MLHAVFGQGVAASVFSLIYVAWIGLIPLTLMWALVWSRNHALGSWFVTAFAVDWALGAATYFAFPTLGPVYSDPGTFAGLHETTVTSLQSSMIADRSIVLGDPTGHHALQSIAAFASLHVGLTVTVCLLVELVGRTPVAAHRWPGSFLVLTSLATVYLGWHFFVDTLGGVVVGAAAVWVAALATGNHVGWRPRLVRQPRRESSAGQPEPASAALTRAAQSSRSATSTYLVRGQKNPRSPSPLVRGTTWQCRCGTDCETVLFIATKEP